MFYKSYASLLVILRFAHSVDTVNGDATTENCALINSPVYYQYPTRGRGALVTQGNGASAHSTCVQLGADPLEGCQRFASIVGSAIAAILLSISNTTAQNSSAQLSAGRSPVLDKRSTDLGSNVASLLKGYGHDYESVVARHTASDKQSRDFTSSNELMLDVAGIAVNGRKNDIALRYSGNGAGQATVIPRPHARRNSILQLEALHGSSNEPGFKISYTSYPLNLIEQSMSIGDAGRLGSQMSNDWAYQTLANNDISRYFGVFGQEFSRILVLQNIPEIRGFGNNWENPNVEILPDLPAWTCLLTSVVVLRCLLMAHGAIMVQRVLKVPKGEFSRIVH